MSHNIVLASPVGPLAITHTNDTLTRVEFANSNKKTTTPTHPFAKKIQTEINAYFNNPKQKFAIKHELSVTEFQGRVLKAMQNIPVGQTRTYGDVAAELNSSARAVGNACRSNPLPIIIPCHRIVAKNGLGGFSGDTTGRKVKIKAQLLALENEHQTIGHF